MPGLYVLKNYNKKGYYLESLESGQIRFVSNSKNKVLALGNIDLVCYDRNVPLRDVFQAMHQAKLPVPRADSLDTEITAFFRSILFGYDESKVFVSILKKLLQWYRILIESNLNDLELYENKKDDGLQIL